MQDLTDQHRPASATLECMDFSVKLGDNWNSETENDVLHCRRKGGLIKLGALTICEN